MLEKLFHLNERNTNVKTEAIAGLTTFMTMAYILAVNPSILSASGMDAGAILMATAISAFIGCLAMALLANYPFALAPGLGLNAYFAYTVCGTMGYDWRLALFAVFLEGLVFIVLSLTNVREALFNAIPIGLKKGISVGIGLFIAFIGLQNGHIVSDGATLVTMSSFKNEFHTVGISALLALIGTLIVALLSHYRVKGAILYGMLITWVMGIVCQLTGLYVVDAEAGFNSLLPVWSSFSLGAIGNTIGQCFRLKGLNINILDLIVVMCSFLFVDLFDTLGTLIGVGSNAGLLDKDGKLPGIKPALLADAIATSAGAVLGTSTVTTMVESSAGVAEGGKTGLASIFTGALFLISVILAPIFIAIPGFATAPALIYVGFLMLKVVTEIDYSDLTESIPAYLALLFMPLTYSISDGIAVGCISYVVINLATGNRKKISPVLYVLAVLFILKYILL